MRRENKIIRMEALRKLVAEKFPEAVPQEGAPICGNPKILRSGVVTEISGSLGGTGLLMEQMLCQETVFSGWIDGTDALEVGEFSASVLRRLLWVRCHTMNEAIQAADLLIRDGNLALLLLDLRGVSRLEIARVPASTWHRFQRLLEQGTVALGICTVRACIPAARLRVHVSGQWKWTLRDMLVPRRDLAARMTVRITERGILPGTERRVA